jgi:hypothetical protein
MFTRGGKMGEMPRAGPRAANPGYRTGAKIR